MARDSEITLQPDPAVPSAEIGKPIDFAGRRYFHDRQTGYYRTDAKKGDREYLHRAMWKATYGNIPHGWHVHHRDGDTNHNDLTNFECLPMTEHVHQRHKRMVSGNCLYCGTPFTRRHIGWKPVYCSTACSTRFHNERRYG